VTYNGHPMGQGSVRLVEPDGSVRPPKHELAPRVSSLVGLRLGVLDNGKANADVVLEAIVGELQARFRISEVVRHRKTNPGLSATEVMFKDLEACGAVVVGTGD
jgi:hypothetical protein